MLNRRGLLAGLSATVLAQPAFSATLVDLALVLSIDCSYSIDPFEFQQQMRGTARAFLAPEILKAIARGPNKKIAVSAYQWSDPGMEFVLVPWQLLQTAADIAALANVFLGAPRNVPRGTTATGSALLFAQSMLQSAPPAFRRVIDVSTDGECNSGSAVNEARDLVVAQGTVINGLAITQNMKDLESYLKDNVIGGNQSFVMPANDYDAYGQSLLDKLFREITSVDLI